MARFLLKTGKWVLTLLVVVLFYGNAWAKYEVTNVQSSVQPSIIPQKGPTQDLSIQWDKPSEDPGEAVTKYVYMWNNSSTSLDDDQLNGTTKGGEVLDPFLTKAKSFFANDDYDIQWYVHIKTVYGPSPFIPPESLSADVVVGPFNFDNVAPTGTIALDTAVAGQTATTSTVNPVTLKLTASGDTLNVYLNNTDQCPATEVAFAGTLTHEVTEGVGPKTVYAWFEDQAGNVSAFVQLSFQLIAGKSMDPAGDFILSVNGTHSFLILGAGVETYEWTIVDPVTGNPTTVATFSGPSTGVVQVDVVGASEGAFKVKATPDGGTTVYESGEITVTGTLAVNIPLIVGWNLISMPNQPADTSVASVLTSIDGKYTSVWTYDTAADTWYKYYTPATGLDFLNDLTEILPGKGYWVVTDQNATLTVIAPVAPATTVSLSVGWNLVGLKKEIGAAITTAMASINGKYTSIWSYDTGADNWYKYYTPATGLDFLNDMSDIEVGKG